MIIYLAGGMKDGWQDHVIPLLQGHEIFDPRSLGTADPAVYTELDLAAIRRADCLLAYMNSANPSGFGLSVEIGYAYALGKWIIFCDEIKGDWRSKFFGMHRDMASVVCSNLTAAVAAAQKPICP